VKAWPIDPLDFRNFKLEVSEKLPQGLTTCDDDDDDNVVPVRVRPKSGGETTQPLLVGLSAVCW